jgi:hypothetical protein
LVVGVVAAAAIALGVTVSIWLFQYLSQPERVLAPEIPSAIIVDRAAPISFERDSRSLLSEMRQVLANEASGLTQVYPLVSTPTGDTRPANGGEVLNAIAFSAPGTFVRNLDGITIAGTDPTAVAIVLTFADFETALGGMYRWEPNIVSDFSDLIGPSPTTRFIDATSENRDIRVAQRGDGTELIYTFIDRNTLLITNNRGLINEVVTRLK